LTIPLQKYIEYRKDLNARLVSAESQSASPVLPAAAATPVPAPAQSPVKIPVPTSLPPLKVSPAQAKVAEKVADKSAPPASIKFGFSGAQSAPGEKSAPLSASFKAPAGPVTFGFTEPKAAPVEEKSPAVVPPAPATSASGNAVSAPIVPPVFSFNPGSAFGAAASAGAKLASDGAAKPVTPLFSFNSPATAAGAAATAKPASPAIPFAAPVGGAAASDGSVKPTTPAFLFQAPAAGAAAKPISTPFSLPPAPGAFAAPKLTPSTGGSLPMFSAMGPPAAAATAGGTGGDDEDDPEVTAGEVTKGFKAGDKTGEEDEETVHSVRAKLFELPTKGVTCVRR
jgi:hypothetical protein